MAYAQPFLSVEMSGNLALGQEIWSCGFHIANNTTDYTTTQLAALATEAWAYLVRDAIVDFITNDSAIVPADVKLTEVKISVRDTTGATFGDPVIVTASAQGDHVGGYAPQNALVVTLQSLKPRAPGRYNRFYVPISASGLGDGPFLNGSQQESYANVVVAMIEEINSVTQTAFDDEDFAVSVVSPAQTGFQLPVAAVKIGKIIDTQQRRRNALTESYYTATVTI